MNIAQVLLTQAEARGDDDAIIDAGGRIGFAQLAGASARAAGLLHAAGLRRGDAVLVFVPMSIELYVAMLAVFRLGLVAMFLDPSAGLPHIERCCAIGRPRGFIGTTKAHLLRLRSRALRTIPHRFVVGPAWSSCLTPGATAWRRWRSASAMEAVEPADADTPALLTFTSGSTGEPKAAMRTHGFLLAQHRALEQAIDLRPGQIDLTALPIFVLANLGSGVTSIVPDCDLRAPGRAKVGRVRRQIARHKPTRFTGSPALVERVLCEPAGEATAGEACVDKDDAGWHSLTRVYTGGGPVFPGTLRRIEAALPRGHVVAVYGSTEAEPIAHVAYDDITDDDWRAMETGRGLLAGRVEPTVTLRVLPDRWGETIGPMSREAMAAGAMPAGEAGEIVVTGEHVLKGYLHGAGDEQTKFRVGEEVWHRTGDAGYLDESGRLWLLGRCAAKIADEHGVLYPFAAECVAMGVEGVVRAAAVAHAGRRVLAVQMASRADAASRGRTLDALHEALAWAGFDEIVVLRCIPVDARHNAKIEYGTLHAALELERGSI